MKKLDCQTTRELLPASVLDALEVDEELALLEHLQACPGCRAEADDLRLAANSLGMAAPDAGRPSPQTRLHMMAKLNALSKPPATPLPQRRWTYRPAAALVPAAIAFMLVIELGAVAVSLQ